MNSLQQRFRDLPNADRIGYLIGGFITRNLTLEEDKELDNWVVENEDNMQFFEDATDDRNAEQFLRMVKKRSSRK